MLRFIRLAVIALAVLSMPPAHALFGDDEARKAILDLRKQVQDMEKRVQDMQGKGVDLGGRMERLEGAQRGSLEIANQLDALRQDIAKLCAGRSIKWRTNWAMRRNATRISTPTSTRA